MHFCVQRIPLSDHSYQVPHSHSRSADSALQIGVAMRRVSCIASVAKDPRMLKMLSASSKWKADQYGVTITLCSAHMRGPSPAVYSFWAHDARSIPNFSQLFTASVPLTHEPFRISP